MVWRSLILLNLFNHERVTDAYARTVRLHCTKARSVLAIRHLAQQHHDCGINKKKVKASSYIAQYPVLRTVQSALHFTSLTDLFTQTPSRLLWEASSHMLQLMREGCSYTYPPLSIVRYSFIQLSELEQCRVKKLAQGFNTAARIRTRVLIVDSPKPYP